MTGWLAGKAWKRLDDRYEITGRKEPRLCDAASVAADMDMKMPTISRFDQNKWDKQGERFLSGQDYDLGGQASTYLRAAQSNLHSLPRFAKKIRIVSLDASGLLLRLFLLVRRDQAKKHPAWLQKPVLPE